MTDDNYDYSKIFPYLDLNVYKDSTTMLIRNRGIRDKIVFNLPLGIKTGHVNIGMVSTNGKAWLTITSEDVENLLLACQYLLQEHYGVPPK